MSSRVSTARGRGLLFVVSAPSGTGKTTLVERLVEAVPALAKSRSYTSRARRPGELDGVDYNFISRASFEGMAREDAFLEWADVFGHLYGTGRQDTERQLVAGTDVVLVIDVQGARHVRTRLTDTVGIFVLPPSQAVLEARLRGRCQDEEAAIVRRLAQARTEVSAASAYDYVVVNDDLGRCVAEMASIVAAERARLDRRRAVIDAVAATFDL
jgi:guanylate kinase